MDAQLKKGLLDVCVLAVLDREDSYGYKLIEDTKLFIEMSESTLYPILKRLELGGYLTTYSKEFNGRLRKYYTITSVGRERLDECYYDWLEMKDIYEKLFGGK